MPIPRLPALIALLLVPQTASASDEAFELWFNPSLSFEADSDTGLEIETAQRFRSAADGRPDTWFLRLWVNQAVSPDLTLSGAVERRINAGDSDEVRLIQQLSGSHGLVRTRLRLEQRFVQDADRMGLRLRPRLGLSVPLDGDKRWKAKADAELFFTLRATSRGGDRGLTGLRTQVGISRSLGERLSLSLVYLRQQDIRPERPDRIGHAPLLAIEYAF